MPFRFAHMSDVHLGSWGNHPDLKEKSVEAFERAIDDCIAEKVDFLLIAGDLFDTALPPIDIIRRAASKLRECRDSGMRIYAIAGSHDFSPTGKTMLSVLDGAGLIEYVAKHNESEDGIHLEFTTDERTGAKIVGVVGKKGALDIECFDKIDRSIEQEPGFKIFMFHSAIAEYRPKNMEEMPAVSLDSLPRKFNYYATGHVHVSHTSELGGAPLVFPNALFPTEFPELEKNDGGFVIVDVDDNDKLNIQRRQVKLFDVVSQKFDATGRTPNHIEEEILAFIEKTDLAEKALLLSVKGVLESGRPSEIDMQRIASSALEKGAFTVKRSLSGLSTKEFEEVKIMENLSAAQIEQKLISEHKDQMQLAGFESEQLVTSLLSVFQEEKAEDETVATYESRIKENAKKVLGLDE